MRKLNYLVFWTPFLLSLGLLWHKLSLGPRSLVLLDFSGALAFLRLKLTLDTVSATVFCMITLLVGVIGQYAYHYLDRQKGQAKFFANLVGILLSVSLMIAASSLLYVLVSWWFMSFFLSNLMLYNPERLQARLAVRKKFWISRIGDLSLLVSMILIYRNVGTLEFDGITQAVAGIDTELPLSLLVAGGLLCLSALVKSVQFPFHVWLPETMENPAPVSAMMHAGIVNAGGLLLIRASGLLEAMPLVMILTAFAGAISAVFGSLVMLTQNDIKKKLAYSTISQMGMMIFACGIGAFSIALIHIIAHSLYKSHAFLSTGNLITESMLKPFKPHKWRTLEWGMAVMLGLVIIVIGGSHQANPYFSLYLYGAVLMLGVLECSKASYAQQQLSLQFLGFLIVTLCLGFLFYASVESYLVAHATGFITLAKVATTGVNQILLASTFVVFALGFILKQKLRNDGSDWAPSLYHFLHNGGYLSQRFNRILLSHSKGINHA